MSETPSEPSRHIPEPLRRQVMVEAGHRCAVPTCRGTAALEVHHIVDWSKVKEHTFDNLICLCAVDHHRATTGEIDRLAMLQYKANLMLLHNRYGDLEQRVLEVYVLLPEQGIIELPVGSGLQMWYLQRDGIVERVAAPNNPYTISGVAGLEGYQLTAAGHDLVARLREARRVE